MVFAFETSVLLPIGEWNHPGMSFSRHLDTPVHPLGVSLFHERINISKHTLILPEEAELYPAVEPKFDDFSGKAHQRLKTEIRSCRLQPSLPILRRWDLVPALLTYRPDPLLRVRSAGTGSNLVGFIRAFQWSAYPVSSET